MAVSEDYQRLVLDDMKTYAGMSRPLRSSILARILIRQLPIDRIHPNPEDEFCDPAIGPSGSIISDYIARFSRRMKNREKPVEEKLMVEKMSTGGYMLLNGHHRWMAAHRLGLRWLPVSIVNSTSEAEILSAIDRSDKRMCVSFDLDEVLLTDCNGTLADHPLPFPYNFLFKRTLRKNAGVLINELQALGFDVWVYAGSGIAQEAVNRLMSLHKAKVNGTVMVIKGKRSNQKLKQAFRGKYELSLHIDNESILWVNTRTKAYESIPVAGDTAWAADVLSRVRALEECKRITGEASHA